MSDLWTKRLYDPATDEDAVMYLWLKSYSHASLNVARGAHRDHTPAERKYWREHAPIVECLLQSGVAQTYVLCDPARVHATEVQRDGATHITPPVILAFACVSGDVVHYASVKRHYAREGFGPEMLRDLLGDRLDRVCSYTHELPEMRPAKKGGAAPSGLVMPAAWVFDPWWLSREFVGGARKEAA